MPDHKPEVFAGTLLEAARSAKENAYAPYSKFRVGAALFTAAGRVYRGCNVENASFGLTVCAERVALFKAVSEGEREFLALGVIGDGEDYCVPCGACLQVLAEFNPGLELFVANRRGEYIRKRLDELLPMVFVLAGVCENRTHQGRSSRPTTGFEDQEGHQAPSTPEKTPVL